ncbi:MULTISPECIES: methyl-accepting chemotaxis protein [Giesbergeria]|uniref:Methyl-accepting chemotaxis protein n=1 Tax=Giesbergeria sinuosa TaxID=80883 RepID=A0ABV9QFU3_9BURK
MFSSLRTRMVALCVGIVALAMIIVATTNFMIGRSSSLEMLHSQASALAKAHSAALGQWVHAKQRVVASLKDHVTAENPVPMLQTAVKAAQFDQAYMGFPDKHYVFSENRKRAADYDPTQRAWYKGAVQAAGPSITQPFIGASSGKLIITFSDLVGTSAQVQAVTAGDVMLDSVIAAIAAIKPTPHSFAFLVSGNGTIIAHPDHALTLKPITAIHPALSLQVLKDASTTQERMMDFGGREGMVYSDVVPGSDWRLAIVMDHAEVTTGLDTMFQASVGSTLLMALVAAVLLYVAISRALARLQDLRQAITTAGEGDFTCRVVASGTDELSQIAQAYNRFADHTMDVLHHMRDTSRSVEMATAEIASGNRDLSERTEQQAHALRATVASVEKLTGTVRANADNAVQANRQAQSASQVARKGGEVVSGVVTMMEEINQSSRKIADINGVIDSIAFQTNILALNAAVEAARAGEQGRGFAVVASEVRTLAQRSAAAAHEISALINMSVEKVHSGSTLVQQAGATMQEIVSSVQEVTGIIAEISQASGEQIGDIEQISQAIIQMEDNTQQNTALVEEAAAAAASLQDQATNLAQMASAFVLDKAA